MIRCPNLFKRYASIIADSSELFVLESDVTIQIQAVSLLTSLGAAADSRALIPARPLQLQNDRYVYFVRPRCLLLPWRQRAEIPSAHWFDTLPLSLGGLLVRFSGFALMKVVPTQKMKHQRL